MDCFKTFKTLFFFCVFWCFFFFFKGFTGLNWFCHFFCFCILAFTKSALKDFVYFILFLGLRQILERRHVYLFLSNVFFAAASLEKKIVLCLLFFKKKTQKCVFSLFLQLFG